MHEIRARKRWYVPVVVGVAAIAAAISGTAQSSKDKWWPGYGNGPDTSRYFASKQINKSNVTKLEVAWTYPYSDASGYPIVVHGAVYGRGRNGSLVAVNAKTGKEIWVRENMNGMSTRGVMYWESADGRDQRLIFPMNSLLQEVDAKTGKSVMSFGTNGVVDLREGIDGRDPATIGNIQSNTPGKVFEDLVIVGSATGEGYMSPPGDIRAYNVLTGKLAWTFHTVPHPGEFGYDTWPKDAYKYIGGNNNWGEMTVDTQLGMVFIPLGSPTYDFYGLDRIGADLFGTAVVALDARTGKHKWHFQFVHHDLWDSDPSAAPSLTTIKVNGKNRDVIALTAKTGWLYVLDRATGEPIWPIEEKPFPKSEVPGEQSWPTQPIPTKPEPYIRHTFTVDDVSPYLDPTEADAFKKRLAAATNKGVFTPINFTDTVHVPTSNGGTLFGGTAAEPRNGAVYIIAHDNPGIMRLVHPGDNAGRRGGGGPRGVPPGQAVYEKNCQGCHGADRLGTDAGVPLVYASDSPANNIAAGTFRFDADTIRTVVANGKGRMPALPHITGEDLESIVSYLTSLPGGRGRGGFAFGPGRGGRGPVPSGAPPELIAGSGSAWNRPGAAGGRGGRGAAPPYPEGVTQFERPVIAGYDTVGTRIKPPFTSIVKYDLNKPGIQWRIPYGDDPELAARGIHNTGTPGTTNSLVITESGLVFGAGGDNQVRAWDSDTGKQLWSSPFGGNFLGSLVMYEMDGRQYLLVPAASFAGGGRGRRGAATGPGASNSSAPLGWVAYALPAK
ncbi:MAG TPA: PQQ-binding-like beta-propeller repeat protein [Candidatus Limnocylindrales bacterium]|nr:PQQ-binding-like beta-propeller repeat protein [Candidatus Limnocylindrales bacterium]